MPVKVIEEALSKGTEYGTIPIRFEVASRFRVEPMKQGLEGIRLIEEPVAPPYIKDYDDVENESPARWLKQWDTSNWGMFSAFDGAQRAGGAVIAGRTPNVNMMEGRDDLAVLWDLRVHPDYRGQSIGHQVFNAAVAWAKEGQYIELKIETQNNNVPACRFYARQGCILSSIVTHAYDEFPDEIQFIGRLKLKQ